MKKEYWIVGVIAVLVLLGGYLGRHKIRALLMGAPARAPSSSPTSAKVLTDPAGMTLYTFDKDTKNTSNCYGACATTWPPYLLGTTKPTLTTPWGTTQRTDGGTQYTYNGMPLYYYSGDKNPGDTNGDGFKGIWHLVKL